MAKVYKGIQELIGNTPLVEAVNLDVLNHIFDFLKSYFIFVSQ